MPPRLVAPAPAGPSLEPTQRRRLDHLRALFTQTPVVLSGNLAGLLVVAAIFGPLGQAATLAGWLAVAATLWLLRLAHYLRYRRQAGADVTQLERWRRSWTALVLAQGAMWGLAVWLFWDQGEGYQRLALLLIVYAYCLVSVHLLSAQWPVFIVFVSLVLLPAVARVALDDSQPWHWQLATIVAILFGLTLMMGRSTGTALDQAIELKAQADEMARQLRREKTEAEAAQRAADAANRAKTQFFAAASHDLRQPLHAMGLFAEALRQRVHDPEVASLVNSINESVDALEGLFAELLDITRIDTGGVEVHPAPVPMRELLARLRLHFEPLAFEKGLQLTLRGGDRVVLADPLLLERVLRNLLSNALRYTEDGGVLLAARRRGDRVLIQVWDSGIGIDAQDLPRVFDEFFQVHGRHEAQPHHRKGLGLGLAIVRRLTTLLGSSIEVRSRRGQGTVFSFELPAAARPREPAPEVAAPASIGLTLQGRLFVVVEDDPAVREGLVVLLQAWGAQVRAFESLPQLQPWLDGEAAATPPPDLLLVDYRLPAGGTGIEVLQALRARWPGQAMPAVLVTGSSLGGHEDQAAEHDYHLLIKPVLPSKLRSMIAFKLGLRGKG